MGFYPDNLFPFCGDFAGFGGAKCGKIGKLGSLKSKVKRIWRGKWIVSLYFT